MNVTNPVPAAAALILMLSACEGEGLSTAETEQAAEERIRQTYGLSDEVDLQSRVFVGRPRDGDVVLCGLTTDPANRIPAQRFIAATDPARWLQIAPAHSASIHAQPDKFPEWDQHCAGADGEAGEEPLAPTAVGKEG